MRFHGTDGNGEEVEGFGIGLPRELGEALMRLLKGARGGSDDDDRGDVVVQRLPIRPEWKALWDEYRKSAEEIKALIRKNQSLHRRLWAKVEEDTGVYDRMRLNDDDMVIEVMGERPKKPDITPKSIEELGS